MYVCIDCGNTFDEPVSWTEDYGERMNGSPCCNAGYAEGERCEYCRNIFPEGTLKHGHCDKCRDTIARLFCIALDGMDMSSDELEIIDDALDGVALSELLSRYRCCPTEDAT